MLAKKKTKIHINLWKFLQLLKAITRKWVTVPFSPSLDLQTGPHFPWSTHEGRESLATIIVCLRVLELVRLSGNAGITKPPPWGSVATNYFNWSMFLYQGIPPHTPQQWHFPWQNLFCCLNTFIIFLPLYRTPSSPSQVPQGERALRREKISKTPSDFIPFIVPWSCCLLLCNRSWCSFPFSSAAATTSSWDLLEMC